MTVVTIELAERDAYRLLWLVQKEATQGKIYAGYWQNIAQQIESNIHSDQMVDKTPEPVVK